MTTAAEFDIDVASQRWSGGRHTWRRLRDGGFDPRAFFVSRIDEARARAFVTTHHYSKSFPAARMSFGLFTDDERFIPETQQLVNGRALVGVAVLSVPMSSRVVTSVFPDLEPFQESLELGRLVLTDTPSNAESWFLRRAFDLAQTGGVRGVISFSDPLHRVKRELLVDGSERVEEIMPGHVGICYQATNALALGRSTPRTLTYLPRLGSVLSARTLQKIRAGESGSAAAERRLVELGATSRGASQHSTRWLRTALQEVGAVSIRHPGNYRYAWGLDKVTRKGMGNLTRTPYPKQATGVM